MYVRGQEQVSVVLNEREWRKEDSRVRNAHKRSKSGREEIERGRKKADEVMERGGMKTFFNCANYIFTPTRYTLVSL